MQSVSLTALLLLLQVLL